MGGGSCRALKDIYDSSIKNRNPPFVLHSPGAPPPILLPPGATCAYQLGLRKVHDGLHGVGGGVLHGGGKRRPGSRSGLGKQSAPGWGSRQGTPRRATKHTVKVGPEVVWRWRGGGGMSRPQTTVTTDEKTSAKNVSSGYVCVGVPWITQGKFEIS